MCGRTVCSLAPEELCRACQYGVVDGRPRQTRWRNDPGNYGSYSTSYNLAPTDFGPVMISGSQEVLSEEYSSDEYVIQPMKWGLVPSWFHGDPDNFQYKMINARVESLSEKASFRNALNKGRRCVVLADGFYEWHSTEGTKQPYFVHFPQKSGVKFDQTESIEKDEKWNGRRMLTMAGIFDICKVSEHTEPLFTYTVITVESSKSLSWLHDRMPAILETEEVVEKWLDFENVPLDQAVNLLSPVEKLDFYPVSRSVNNVKIKDSQCVIPLSTSSEKSAQLSNKRLAAGTVPITKFFKIQPNN